MIAVKMLGPLKEEARKRQVRAGEKYGRGKVSPLVDEPIESSGDAVRQAAKIVGVSRTTVHHAKAVAERAPQLAKEIKVNIIPELVGESERMTVRNSVRNLSETRPTERPKRISYPQVSEMRPENVRNASEMRYDRATYARPVDKRPFRTKGKQRTVRNASDVFSTRWIFSRNGYGGATA